MFINDAYDDLIGSIMTKLDDSAKEKKRLNVAIVAYECSPVRGHAAGAAWHIVRRLSDKHNLTIITEMSQYKIEIEEYLKSYNLATNGITFIFLPRVGKGYRNNRPVLPMISIILYRYWLWRAYRKIKTLHANTPFDLVHHLRADTFREPGYIYKLNIPIVWGPTGGTTQIPWILFNALDWVDRIQHGLRNIINTYQLYLSYRVRQTVKNAKIIFTQTSEDKNAFEEAHHINCVLLHEQNIDRDLMGSVMKIRSYDGGRPLELVWVGQFISRKALRIALDVLKSKKFKGRLRLNIIGDGPKSNQWRQYASRVGVDEYCKWYGWIERKEVLEILRSSDLLFFTSLLEGTSATVLEALSVGLPVICLKHCGLGDVVDSTCGVTVDIDKYNKVVESFENALMLFFEDPELLQRLSYGCISKRETLNWDIAAKTISEAYYDAVCLN